MHGTSVTSISWWHRVGMGPCTKHMLSERPQQHILDMAFDAFSGVLERQQHSAAATVVPNVFWCAGVHPPCPVMVCVQGLGPCIARAPKMYSCQNRSESQAMDGVTHKTKRHITRCIQTNDIDHRPCMGRERMHTVAITVIRDACLPLQARCVACCPLAMASANPGAMCV